ncbi:putative repeat protein (TIGR01451 family) [Phyllobacterium endophyticum]|uniref:DUF7507 domain-containing protein n=1 Tax=Phyllobacterium endophyticum TaxID=1149773 RepID=UPI00161285BC|nr:putative repeat protein (TIGR01451 family) [Phyllobacterium endophyticum]
MKNTGNVTLKDVVLDEPGLKIEGQLLELSPGEEDTASFTAVHEITQADLDKGRVDGAVIATGAAPDKTKVVSGPSETTVGLLAEGKLSIVKTAGKPSGNVAGSTIDYTFVIKNIGNVALTNVSATDTLPGVVLKGGPLASLAPGAEDTQTFTATYTLTQKDVDAGKVENVASVAGKPPVGDRVTAISAPVTVTFDQVKGLAIAKEAGKPSNGFKADSVIPYTFTIRNIGTVTLTNITLSESLKGVDLKGGPIASLAPGAEDKSTFTASYALTQADVDAGQLENSATATGSTPSGETTTSLPGKTLTMFTGAAPDLMLFKDAEGPTVMAVGGVIDYTFTVKNTGDVTLTNIVVEDTLPGLVLTGKPIAKLSPGETEKTAYTAQYTLTQADFDGGIVSNEATATGVTPQGDKFASLPSTVGVTLDKSPALSIVKTAGKPSGSTPGSTINYTFVIRNTGNVTLKDVAVSDKLPGIVLSGGPIALLAPDAEDAKTFTAIYTLTQADLDRGGVENMASVTGQPPVGVPVTATSTTVTSKFPALGKLEVKKTAGVPTGNRLGDTITYTFKVKNTGNVTLKDVVLDEPGLKIEGQLLELSPGEEDTASFTAVHEITQADLDKGRVDGAVTATGTSPDKTRVTSAPSATSVALLAEGKLSIVKTAGKPSGNVAGSTIDYTFVIKNTGNVTLKDVVLDEPGLKIEGQLLELSPGAEDAASFTAVHEITQADLDKGRVDGAVTATGTAPDKTRVASDPSATTVALLAEGKLEVKKTAGVPTGNRPGDKITYTFKVKNTGNVTLKDVVLDEPGLKIEGQLIELSPGAEDTASFTAVHEITQADLDKGRVDGAVTATGTAPDKTRVASDPSATTVALLAEGKLEVKKTAGVPTGNRPGDTITYTFKVKNTGNVTLKDVVLDEPGLKIEGQLIELSPGAEDTASFTAVHEITQADLDKGRVEGAVTATGTSPDKTRVVSDPNATTVALLAEGKLSIVKMAGKPSGNVAGSTINYTFVIKNIGNVTLKDVAVSDKLPGILLSGGPIASLAPDAEDAKTFTAIYTLTQADLDRGGVENMASVTGQPPVGDWVTAISAPVTSKFPALGKLEVKKTAGVPTGNRPGDKITYTFTVKNTGNVTLKDVVLDEPGLKIEGQLLELSPGAEDAASFTAVHEITQADLDKGRVEGAVTATGTSPDKTRVVSDPSATTVALASKPEMAIAKKADRTSFAKVGDKITYIFTITNIGNVTLRNLVVSDKLLSTLPICRVQQLAPAAETSCSADHIVKQADLDTGAVRNVATLTGDGPDGTPLMPIESAPVTTVADVVSKLTVEKTADAPAVVQAGNTIKYTFVVRNEGNVTLSNVTVQDTLPGVVLKGGPIAALAPGEANSTSFSATYVLTQKDVDAGKVVNKATATGTHSRRPVAGEGLIIFGEEPIKSPEVTVPVALAAGPELTILKRAGAPSGNTPGATIAYDFVITNTGNVTLSDVTVTDALPGVLLKGQPIKSLAPGEVNTTAYQAVYTLKQSDIDAGSVENTANVKANPPTGVPITAISPKVSTPIVAAAKLDLLKSIGKPSGRTAGASVPYTFKVSNSGNVTLVNITITDILPGIVIKGGPIPVLAPGQTDTTTFTATYILTQADIVAKRVLNKAKAHGRVPAKAPPKTAMFVRKDVPMIARSVGTPGELNGAPMPLRAPGDEVSSGGGEGGAAPIDSGESAALLEIGEENPELDLVKTGRFNDENGDGHANADETITYRFVVGNKGTATIHDVSVVDEGPVFNGRPAQNKLSRREPVSASIEPGKNQTFTATYRLGQDDIDAAASLEGGVKNKATAQGYNGDGATSTLFHSPESSSVIDLPAADGKDVSITKQAGLRQIRRGEKAPFTIKVVNNNLGNVGAISVTDVLPSGFRYVEGSATVNGVAAIPVILGRNVRFDNLRLGPKADLTIRLQMLALSTAEPGKHTNRARVDEAGGGQLAPEAGATIEIIIDPVFDCGDIAGKVFDDVNNNGYADPDEPGLPGVRVATVKGLLVTTDKHGRFHVACADLPDKRIGSNFIMKLDPRTLPTGYSVTTENPRVIRLTAGKMSKLNFGASIGHVVRLDLTDGAFEDGTTVLKMEWSDSLDGLVEVLKAQPSTLRIFYLVTVARKLAEERLAEIGEDIGKRWKAAGGTYELNIETRTEADQ